MSSDIRLELMRLMDKTIAEHKQRLETTTENFLQLAPSRFTSSIMYSQVDRCLRDITDTLIKTANEHLRSVSLDLSREIGALLSQREEQVKTTMKQMQDEVSQSRQDTAAKDFLQKENEKLREEIKKWKEKENDFQRQLNEMARVRDESLSEVQKAQALVGDKEKKEKYLSDLEKFVKELQAEIIKQAKEYEEALEKLRDEKDAELAKQVQLWQLRLAEAEMKASKTKTLENNE